MNNEMKREYTPPVLQVETFQLAAAVASTCQVLVNHDSGASCQAENLVFARGICVIPEDDADCYHGPIATSTGGSYITS